MKTKVISTRDFAAIKKMAQIVNPLVMKKENIMKKVNTLLEEIKGEGGLDAQIAGMEIGIKAKFFGLGTEQLIKRTVVPVIHEDGTPALDAKTGRRLTKTTWEPLPCLKYNAEENNYTLTLEEEEDSAPISTDMATECDSIAQETACPEEEVNKEVSEAVEEEFPYNTPEQEDEAKEHFYNEPEIPVTTEDNPFGI